MFQSFPIVQLKDDPEFHEFLDVHKSRANKKLWSNDLLLEAPTAGKEQTVLKDQDDADSGVSDSRSSDEEEPGKEVTTITKGEPYATNRIDVSNLIN